MGSPMVLTAPPPILPAQVVLSDGQYKKFLNDVGEMMNEGFRQVNDNVQAWGKYFLERQAPGAQTSSAPDTTSQRIKGRQGVSILLGLGAPSVGAVVWLDKTGTVVARRGRC